MNKFYYELIYQDRVIKKFLFFRDLWKTYQLYKKALHPDDRQFLTYEVRFIGD